MPNKTTSKKSPEKNKRTHQFAAEMLSTFFSPTSRISYLQKIFESQRDIEALYDALELCRGDEGVNIIPTWVLDETLDALRHRLANPKVLGRGGPLANERSKKKGERLHIRRWQMVVWYRYAEGVSLEEAFALVSDSLLEAGEKNASVRTVEDSYYAVVNNKWKGYHSIFLPPHS